MSRTNQMENKMQMMTKQDVAQRLMVSERTLESLVSQGQLPAPIRLGKRALWATEAIDTFIKRTLERQLAFTPRNTRRRAS
jgi:excisionase family DNA binding protein